MKKLFQPLQALAILSAGLLTANHSMAQTELWNSSSGSWSTPGNWSAGVVPVSGTNVLFTNNVGAASSAGSLDNTVDNSFGGTIASLQYANTNTGGAAGFYHTTQIASGQTLTVTNGMTVGTLTDAGGTCVVNATITGAGGQLTLNGPGLVVNQASATSGAHFGVLTMSNLDTFVANIGRIQIGIANGVNRAEGVLYLAKTNLITLTGAAPQLYMGFNNGNNDGSTEFPILYLGQSNSFAVDSMTFSADKQGNPASRMYFNPVFTNNNPVAYFRGTNGNTSRVSNWILGNNSGQTTTSSTSDGTNDFTDGVLDAMVNTMTIGVSEHGAGATVGAGNGTFTFSAGSNNVNTLNMGQRLCTVGSSVGNGTMNVNGTGTLVVNNAICMDNWATGGNAAYGNCYLNINGGTVMAATITNGITVSAPSANNNIIMNGGTLGITSLLGSIGTTAFPLGIFTMNNSTLQIPISGIQTNVVVQIFNAGGTSNNISITSIPAGVITYPTQFPLIGYASLGGTYNFVLTNLPGTYQGYISNDTANSLIDLVLTNGPTSLSVLAWSGQAGANWDTTSINWLNGAVPVAYSEGAAVLFNDNATGPTDVNLPALRTPASVTVSNNVLPYAFSGAGIGGSASMVKYGSNTLLFTNSGNAFIGGLTINAGTVQFGAGGTSGTLPVTGNVTNNGNLVFNHSSNDLLPNSLYGTGTLTKNGNNVLTVTATNNFSGNTVVNGGTLVLNGVLSGSLTNALGSTIGGVGTNLGTVNVSGLIQPSAVSGTPSTLTTGNLNLFTGATLAFDLSGVNNTEGSGSNDVIEVTGNLNANNNAVSLNFAGVPQTGVPYTLIDFPSGSQSGSLSASVTGTHFTTTLSQGTSPVTVTLSGTGANLKWDSTSSAIWDSGITANWLNGISSSVFYSGDNVLFDDSVAGVVTNVTVAAGAVYPNVVSVISTNNNFTIAGPGKISGQASIQKYGPSTLTLSSGANDFTNTVQVFAGTLKLGANGAAGRGTVYVSPGAALDLNASTISGAAAVSGTGIGGQGAIVNNGFITGGDQHAFDAGIYLYVQGNTALGCNNRWDIRNGTLQSGDGNPWNITILGSNMLALVNATVDDSLGSVDVQSGTFAIQTTTLSASPGWAGNSAHTNTVENGATLELDFSAATALGQTLVLNNGSTLQDDGTICTLNGPVTLSGNVSINNSSTATLELDGILTGSGGFTKTGAVAATTMTLTAADTYTGSTVINIGSLLLTGSGSIFDSTNINVAAGAVVDVSGRTDTTLTLASGQTLQGAGAVNGILTAGTGSIVAPGVSSSSTGTLTVSNTTSLGGTTLMKLNATTGASDQLNDTNGIAFGGTLTVTNISGTITNGQTFQLFVSTNYTGAFAVTNLPTAPGLTWTNNLAVNGTLTAGVVSGPAPQPHITSVSLSGTNLVIMGTNGVNGEQYNILTTTNLSLPLSSWTVLPTNTFGGGNFSLTNGINPGTPQNFYILRVP